MVTPAKSMYVLCSYQLPCHQRKCCRCFSAFGSSVDVVDFVTHSETLPKMKDAFGALSSSMSAKETNAP